MTPYTTETDLWITDEELEESFARLDRVLARDPVAPSVLRPPFHVDYLEAD